MTQRIPFLQLRIGPPPTIATPFLKSSLQPICQNQKLLLHLLWLLLILKCMFQAAFPLTKIMNHHQQQLVSLLVLLVPLHQQQHLKLRLRKNEKGSLKSGIILWEPRMVKCNVVIAKKNTRKSKVVPLLNYGVTLKFVVLTSDIKNSDPSSFDVLQWWKANAVRYPVLSKLARDVLSIPITTVASESAFSAGGRVLDDYRSSLKEDVVEILVCGGDWIRAHTRAEQQTLQQAANMEEDLNIQVSLSNLSIN